MESYEEWRKERERGAIILFLIPPILMFVTALVISEFAPETPKILKYNAMAAAFILGVAIFCPKAMRRLTYTEEDLLAGYSALVMMATFFFFLMNGFYLVDSGILTTNVSDFLWYASFLMLPSTITATFLTYEILDSRRTKRSLIFRFKRVFGRFCFAAMFWIGCLITFKIFSLFNADEHMILFAFVTVEIILLVLVLQFREFFDDLMSGEW